MKLYYICLLVLISSMFCSVAMADDSILVYEAGSSSRTEAKVESARKTDWSLSPGISFRRKADGLDWSWGPRLTLSKDVVKNGRLYLGVEYLPLKFIDLKSGSRVETITYDVGYRQYLNSRLYASVGYGIKTFSPSSAFKDDISSRGGVASRSSVGVISVAIGYRIFDFKFKFANKRREIPIYLELGAQYGSPYEYGAYTGRAGSSFKNNSALSFRIKPFGR